MTVATLRDVEDRLGAGVDADGEVRVEALIAEAVVLVESYLGGPVPQDPTPDAIRVVVSRMVARVIQAPEPSFSVDTMSNTAGPFSQSRKFTTGASGGAPWLTANDKLVLDRFRRRKGFYSVEVC